MYAAWKEIPRGRPPKTKHLAQGRTNIDRFVKFLRKRYPSVREMADVQKRIAADFMKTEAARGVSPKTYNSTLIFFRSCFHRLHREAGLAHNPFEDILLQEESPIFRKPFDEEELTAIVEAAKEDPFIHPIIITAICTAMRKGDCCLLRWESVDMENRFITVKTSKTGAIISIPLFSLLYETLTKIDRPRDGYVFPDQAAIYREKPDEITR